MIIDDLQFEAHEQWRQHPVTVQLLKNLEKHKNAYLKAMVSDCIRPEVPDNFFRQSAAVIKEIDTIMISIKDFSSFNHQQKQ